jgi:hypothetical protein
VTIRYEVLVGERENKWIAAANRERWNAHACAVRFVDVADYAERGNLATHHLAELAGWAEQERVHWMLSAVFLLMACR